MNRAQSRKAILPTAMILLAAILQFYPFARLFHLTADDNLYQFIAFGENPKEKSDFTDAMALEQGRIGYYLSMDLSYIGNYYIDYQPFRYVVVVIFAAMYAALFKYFDILLGTRLFLVATALAVALVPLVGHHMPPNSYPLLITLPVLILTILRLIMYHLSWENKKQRWWVISGNLLFIYLLIMSEYILAIGAALIGMEVLARRRDSANALSAGSPTAAGRLLDRTRRIITPKVMFDLLSVTAALLVSLGFRYFYYSSYQYGGVTVGSVDGGAVALVQFWHTVGGLSPLHWRPSVTAAGLGGWLKAGAIAICLGYGVWLSWAGARPRSPLAPLLAGLIWIFIVTLPIGLSQKYQQWCFESNECYYVDSRLAFAGLCIALVAAFYLVERLFSSGSIRRSVQVISVSIISFSAAVTSLSNDRFRNINLLEKPFILIQNYACIAPNPITADQYLIRYLRDQIAWHPNIIFHQYSMPEYTREMYLARYLAWWRKHVSGCDLISSTSYNKLLATATLLPPGIGLLNWWEQEPWGRWSRDTWAALTLAAPAGDTPPAMINLHLHAYTTPVQPSQRLLVQRNGVELCRLAVSDAPMILSIPFERMTPHGGMLVEFHLPDATAPAAGGASQDARVLGVGLTGIELLDRNSAVNRQAEPNVVRCGVEG